MTCSQIPDDYLRRRLAVIDVASEEWAARRAEQLTPGTPAAVCLYRLAKRGSLRRLRRGLYLVVDPVRETPSIAVASAAFATGSHYVTTDAALVFHGLIDQPTPVITVVVAAKSKDALRVGGTTIRPVTLAPSAFASAERYATTTDGFPISVASRVQAIVDALAEPHWMTHGTLLPEVIGALDAREIDAAARNALKRSGAAAQRLGYLLEESGQPQPQVLADFRSLSTADLRPGRRSGIFSTRWRVRA
jgi:predicted transcriptional regulator of viral defense system